MFNCGKREGAQTPVQCSGARKSPVREVVRSSVGADAIHPPPPFGGYTHFGFFCSCQLHLQKLGNPGCAGTLSGRVGTLGEHTAWWRFESWPAGSADRQFSQSAPEPFVVLNPSSNPSNHKLLTPPPKQWYPVSGGERSQIQKIHWGIVLLGKIMILQGVGHPMSCLGECYANLFVYLPACLPD